MPKTNRFYKKIVCIIQARTSSTRLPKKVLKDIWGKSALERMIARVKKSRKIDLIVVATTRKEEDKVIIKLAEKCKIKTFAGSEDNVLDRYYQCAKKYKADIIVRLTGDCPLIDPQVIDEVIDNYLNANGNLDYVSIGPSYPDGLDSEVFSFFALEKSLQKANLKSEKEHVTSYIWKNPNIFRIKVMEHRPNLGYLRWTLDEPKDMVLIKKIYKHMHKNKSDMFYMKDILNLIKKHPELLEINKGIGRNEGYQKSVNEDKIND